VSECPDRTKRWINKVIFSQDQDSYWGYECIEDKCERRPRDASNIDRLETIQVCQLMCEEFSTLWPRPSGGYVANKKYPVSVDYGRISFDFPSIESQAEFWATAEERFFKFVESGVPEVSELANGNFSLKISVVTESASLGEFALKYFSDFTVLLRYEIRSLVSQNR
jgi:hypothetical protein